MITNGASDTQREKLGVTGIERVFAAIFISAEVGIVKPDPAIFHLALDKLSVGADAAVYSVITSITMLRARRQQISLPSGSIATAGGASLTTQCLTTRSRRSGSCRLYWGWTKP